MTHLVDHWVIPWLMLLADWSIRWGAVLAPLAVWFTVRPPRRTAFRYLLCLAALAAGFLLPIAPRWGNAVVPWPSWRAWAATGSPATEPPAAGPEGPDATPAASWTSTGSGPDHRALEPVPFSKPARPADDLHRTRPTSPSPGAWPLVALVAAGTWALIVLALLSRLACGWLVLARLKREAVEVTPDSDGLLGECRERLGLSRHVGLALHPAVASPVVAGGLRPVVLVPTDWHDWPESHRRACLLHELAHLVRYDDWAKLIQELLRAHFFFHPLVRWLLFRLDRERELLCDEAAVALGSDPVGYARLLFDLARRPGRLFPVTPLSHHGSLPFLDRRTVGVRIERLLEKDMLSTLSCSSTARFVLLVPLVLAVALGVGGLRITAVSAQQPGKDTKPAAPAVESASRKSEPRLETPAPKPAAPAGQREAPNELGGVVLDPDNRPVPGATLVVGSCDDGKSGHQVLSTDARGRFEWIAPIGTEVACIVAHKQGLATAVVRTVARPGVNNSDLKLRLGKRESFAAVLVDAENKPVASAKIRVRMLAHSSESKNGTSTTISTGFAHVAWEVVAGSPVENLFATKTNSDGLFTFTDLRLGSGLLLQAISADGRSLRIKSKSKMSTRLRRTMDDLGFVTAAPGEVTELVAVPAARIAGRVVTELPGVGVSGLTASFQESRPRGVSGWSMNFDRNVRTDDDGRFTFDGLSEGTVNVFVQGDGENKTWTYRAAKDVTLTPGATAEVTLDLIRGVEVEGTVVARGTGTPVEGADVGVYGPFRPRTSAMTTGAKTDARGRYRYRLPSGETYFYAMGPPKGFTRLPNDGSSRTVTIPDGVPSYEVPPIEIAPAVTVRGRVLDASGTPIAGATVVGMCQGSVCRPFPGAETITDSHGEFRLPPALDNTVAIGAAARLLVRLRGGAEHEAAVLPTRDGAVVVKLPIAGETLGGVEGPHDVSPNELAGVVVDVEGKPIEGAEVDAWTWYPGHETKTDAKGAFRIRGLEKDRKVEVVIRRPGYTPQLFLTQPTGAPGWVIVLGNKTYFEGRVTGPDGKPVAGALLRANCGPKRADGVMITEIWTEAKTDNDGRYRMYAQADIYDIQVRVAGIGGARLPDTSLGADEAKRLDVRLEPGVTFRAKVVDSLTGEPVPGVRLWHWQHPGVEGRSNKDGVIEVAGMLPGRFDFMVDAVGYTRWWSQEAASEWSRRKKDETRGGWQRNFDHVDFELSPGMSPVTITVERGVTVTGRVVDPDGTPVAGATVAPARTGTGNSLTGDTRFSVVTVKEGKFTMVLPASGDCEYNLVAHDGKYGQWRTWANGVLPPFRTKPGEVFRDVELCLTQPATVRGRVTDASGHPIPGREVRASAADRYENRYYDPTVKTMADGRYELKFIRPGTQFIQVAPFWLDAWQAPEGTTRQLTLKRDELKEGVDFRIPGDSKGP